MVESDKFVFSENVSELCFRLADFTCKLEVKGAKQIELWGSYRPYMVQDVEPDFEIVCEAIDDFTKDRSHSAGYPSFVTKGFKDRIAFTRTDVEGDVWVDDESCHSAHFKISPNSHSIESAIRVSCSLGLLFKNAFVIHASAIKTMKGAYVFAGLSEAGKSTISTLLADLHGVTKISDELLVIGLKDGGWNTYVTPFIGSEGLPANDKTALRGLYFLKGKGKVHKCSRLKVGMALSELLRHVTVYGNNKEVAQRALDLASGFVEKVPCFDLSFAKCSSVSNVLGITSGWD